MDDFSDDDFEALNANALQELEDNAIQFTQAQKSYDSQLLATVQAPTPSMFNQQPDTRYHVEDDDLDDAVVVVQDDSPRPMFAGPSRGINGSLLPGLARRQQPSHNDAWRPVSIPVPASHFHTLSVDPSMRSTANTSINSLGLQQIHPYNQALPYSQIARPPPPLPRPAPSIPFRHQSSQAHRPNGAPSHEILSLQAQILDLKSKLTTKDGEITIVRRRLETSRQDHERELQIIKAQTAEQLAKQERVVQAAQAAQESAATELEFTRRDLREEIVRAKREDGPRTPKKNPAAKTWGVSDGFEDVEMAASPSKGKRGKNAGPVATSIVEPAAKLTRTPVKSKRKRPASDSPARPLETHSDVIMLDDAKINDATVGLNPSLAAQRSGPFNYMGAILNHTSGRGRPLIFESLSRFELPSRPGESLASILLQKLSTVSDPNDPTQLPIQFALEVIRLWDACRKEGCLTPITELVSLTTLTIQLQTVALAPYIAPTLLPVAMDTCYEVAIPRFNNSVPGDPTDEQFVKLRNHIETSRILSLLNLTACGCATAPPATGSFISPVVDFWNSVQIHFILTLLNRKQPMEDFLATLRLLSTSVFPDSIGPINPDQPPEVVAHLLIDRISNYLTETPRWDSNQLQLQEARLAVLQTLSVFAKSRVGLAELSKDDSVIPKLVTLLSCCIDELYDGDMRYSSAGDDDVTLGLQKLVAHTVFLIHMIVTHPPGGDPIDVSAKLCKTPGSSQKYLLSLSRLNFAEDLVSEDTAELAHELLELAVTSEAGEELGEFFSNGA